jgi:cysteine desulfurase/selenocysteine lyase
VSVPQTQSNPQSHPQDGPRAAGEYTDEQGRLDADRVRADFPILGREVHGRPLVYLDSAASAQQPRAVLDAVEHYGATTHANVHRGVHALSQEATAAFEAARDTVRRYINARSTREIIFTRGTTEAINLVAQSWGGAQLRSGDEVLITHLEHHANIVPWQMACERAGARLLAAPLTPSGEVDGAAFASLLSPRTRLVAIAHVSNALGTVLPVAQMVALAHARGVPVLVDGAQAIAHQRVDVQQLDCDFYAFSGHKVYGPTGIGVLYGREALLAAMPPWQGGGDMILSVAIERSTYNELPWKFEAGTPNISGAIGLAAALDYVQMLGRERVALHEQELLSEATARLRSVPGLTLVGTAPDKCGVASFTLAGIHPHDVGTILDREGVAIRSGHHCAMPVMTWYGIPATVRASFGCYNTRADIDHLLAGLARVREVFA